MNKFQLIVAAMILVLVGCSDERNPVGPERTSAPATDQTVAKVKANVAASTSTDGTTVPDTNLITVSKFVAANAGGIVTLSGSFTNTGGQMVGYNLSIMFAAGDLPSDQTISITINKSTFGQNADVQFGPEGLVFNHPATLYLFGSNVDIAKKSTSVSLQYWSNGSWVPMGSSWGYYTTNLSGIVFASGKIPHFSRYAFGR